MRDEIIDEIHEIRDAHAAKFKYDLHAICDDLKKTEAQNIAAGHPFITPLPKQMVEVHDPMRLMTIVEHFPEVVLQCDLSNQLQNLDHHFSAFEFLH
ncbi:hypothetical protein EBX93_14075, partial [bacterium]|nr:hypothetical protein [bacterium]